MCNSETSSHQKLNGYITQGHLFALKPQFISWLSLQFLAKKSHLGYLPPLMLGSSCARRSFHLGTFFSPFPHKHVH